MKTYTKENVSDAFEACGIETGDTVLVHSSLMHLGRFKNVSGSDIAERFFEALQQKVGVSGTIVVPTFTFAFCRGEVFNPLASPSEQMGVFSEYVRTLPNGRRSPHPMQSVAAIGAKADTICEGETKSSFDVDGPFAKLVDMDAKGLLLGAPMQSFSLVHLAEERCEVPYRYWKEFTGPYGTPPVNRSFSMYVRDLDLDPRLDLSRIEKALQAEDMLRQAALGAGYIKAFSLRDFHEVTMRGLKESPTWLLQTKPSQDRSN